MSDRFDDTDFVFTNAARMISATNGSLSAASSVLIMSIILRSSTEARASAYHMIMFFMSFWDTIVSVAMALNTIPMPSDVHEIYPFAGKVFGNVGACEVQGFLIWMGTLLVLGSNTTLNLYYVCTLRYSMAEEKFKRRILPVMLVLSMAVSIVTTTATLRMDLFNPSPYRNYCIFASYPYDCHFDRGDTSECIRGGDFEVNTFHALGYILIGAVFLVLVCSLVLVVATVYDAEVAIERSRRIRRRTPRMDYDAARSRATFKENEFKRTRAVLIQALMYIGAFLLTYVWTIITTSNAMKFCNVFFPPLQGFFNAIIFVFQKVHALRQANARLSFFQALKQVILSPSTVPQALVSGMEYVEEDVGERRQGNSRIHRGQTSASLRQCIASNILSIRRFGSNAFELNSDGAESNMNGFMRSNGIASPNHHTNSDDVGLGVGSSSFDFSSGLSVQDFIGPDDSIENTGGERERSNIPDSQSLHSVEDLSSLSMDSIPPSSNLSSSGSCRSANL